LEHSLRLEMGLSELSNRTHNKSEKLWEAHTPFWKLLGPSLPREAPRFWIRVGRTTDQALRANGWEG